MPDERPPLGIFTTDAHLVVRSWDAWLAEVTGIQADDAIGRPLADLVPGLADRGLLSFFTNVLSRGTVEVLACGLHGFLVACRPSRPVTGFDLMRQHVTIGPIREDSTITGLVVTLEDVTPSVAREREVARGIRTGGDNAAVRSAGGGVPPDAAAMTRLLGQPDWRVRRRNVDTLARHGQKIVASLVETLRRQHRDFSVLSSALDLLAISDIDVVEPVLTLLADSDANLRTQAALILGQRRDARAVGPLIARLSDPDPNVRFHVIEALGQLRARAASDALLEVAESGDFFLAFPAVQALSRIGAAGAAPRLVPLLADELLRTPVVEALGQLGDEDVAVPLVQLLNGSDAPAEVVADALAGLYDRYEQDYGTGEHISGLVRRTLAPAGTQKILDAAQRVSSDRLRGLAKVLGWLDGVAAQRALTRLLGHERVRSHVVEALVRHGGGVVALLVEQLGAEDLETRQAAAVALGRIGDPRAVPALIAALDDAALAVSAAGSLARIGDPRAFEPLLDLLGHPDVAIRQAAIAALNSIGHPEMPQRIAGVLDSDDPLVRESGLRIAGYFGYPECAEQVVACGGDDVEAVRRAAVESLAYFDDPRAASALLHALRHDTPPVRGAAAAALVRLDLSAVVEGLTEALRDPDSWVRFFALRSLGALGAQQAAGAVLGTLQDDPAAHVRLAAIGVIGRLGLKEAVDILEPLTRAPEPDISVAAIRALAQVDSPDAMPILERFLHAPEPRLRLAAVDGVLSRPEARVPALLQWLAAAEDNQDVAQAAVDGLRRVASRQPLGEDATRALVALTAEPGTREAAVRALSSLPVHRIADIAAGLRHTSPAVRRAIVEALSRMKQPEASRILAAALDDPDGGVRLTAVTELKHLGTRVSQAKMMGIARADPDPAVRQAALLAVSGTGAGSVPGPC